MKNEILPLWVDFFEDLQFVRGRACNTVMAYRSDLDFHSQYLKNLGSSIPGFYEFMKQQNLSVRSQARVISSLRTYFKFCEGRGSKSPELRELKPLKVKVSLPKVLLLDEFEKLFKSCSVEDPPVQREIR